MSANIGHQGGLYEETRLSYRVIFRKTVCTPRGDDMHDPAECSG